MAFRYDPELEAILAPVAQAMAPDGSNREHGWKEVREESELGLAMLNDMSPPVPEVSSTDYELVRDDGARIALRWYVPDESDRTSAVVYLHGGGMICGSVDLYEPVVAAYVGASGVRMLAVDYRVAPSTRTRPRSRTASRRWAGSTSTRRSSGSIRAASRSWATAAAVAWPRASRSWPTTGGRRSHTRSSSTRCSTTATPRPTPSWSRSPPGRTTATGSAGRRCSARQPAATTSRATPRPREQDLARVAPTYVEVGELDIFRDEDIDYARRLGAAGVSVELHVHPGAPHGFDRIAPQSGLVRRAMADRLRVLQAL